MNASIMLANRGVLVRAWTRDHAVYGLLLIPHGATSLKPRWGSRDTTLGVAA